MGRFIIAFIVLCFPIHLLAQNPASWVVYHNNIKKLIGYDTLLKEGEYRITIEKASLDSAGSLIVEYSGSIEPGHGEKWIRTIQIVDKYHNQHFKIENSNRIEVSNAELKKIFSGRKKVEINTFALPPPGSNYKIKMRIIHLCTLRLR